MIDISPLQDEVEAKENPEIKDVLQVALELLVSGYTSHFTRLYKKGSHVDLMGPKGAVALRR